MSGVAKFCATCGQQLVRHAYLGDAAWEKTKYCSRACFGEGRATHRHTKNKAPTATYHVWTNMLTRCRNPKASKFEFYGGRGISVCRRWEIFENFLFDMGERPTPKHSLDRIDPNGNYQPGNCRWITHTEQCRNRRSNVAVVRDDGRRFSSLAEAAESVGGTIGGVWDVCNGKQYRHRGFGWSYA